jgi:hypothetical protein
VLWIAELITLFVLVRSSSGAEQTRSSRTIEIFFALAFALIGVYFVCWFVTILLALVQNVATRQG